MFQCRSRPNLFKVRAKNLAKVTEIGKVMGRNRLFGTYFKGAFPSSSTIKIVFSKHLVVIIQITIRLIINMDDIRQERLSKDPILNLNKRHIKFTKQGTWHTGKEIYGLSGLEKVNSATFPEVKLLAENPCVG